MTATFSRRYKEPIGSAMSADAATFIRDCWHRAKRHDFAGAVAWEPVPGIDPKEISSTQECGWLGAALRLSYRRWKFLSVQASRLLRHGDRPSFVKMHVKSSLYFRIYLALQKILLKANIRYMESFL